MKKVKQVQRTTSGANSISTNIYGYVNSIPEQVEENKNRITELESEVEVINDKIDILDLPDLDAYATIEYSDEKDAETLQLAKEYADKITGSEITEEYIASQDAIVLEQAKEYADKITGEEVTTEYVDNGDAYLQNQIDEIVSTGGGVSQAYVDAADAAIMAEVDTIKEEQIVQNDEITANTEDIAANTAALAAIGNVIENQISGELYGTIAGGVITEGSWKALNFTDVYNTFGETLYTNGTTLFTFEKFEYIDVEFRGQVENTGVSKNVEIRMMNSLGGFQVGETQVQTISDSGRVEFKAKLNLDPYTEYSFEITSSAGGGEITFTNGEYVFVKIGGISAGVSSHIVYDGVENPTHGLNPVILGKQDKEVWSGITVVNNITDLTTKFRKLYVHIYADMVISIDFPDIIENTGNRLYVPVSFDPAVESGVIMKTNLYIPNLNKKTSAFSYSAIDVTDGSSSTKTRDIIEARGIKKIMIVGDIAVILLTIIISILAWMIRHAIKYKEESNRWKEAHHAEQVRQSEQIKNLENEVKHVRNKE